MWQTIYQPQAIKVLKKLDNTAREKILDYLENVTLHPESFGKPLSKNLKGFWRYRVGDYRIICDLRKNELIILVIDIGHRSTIYKR
ncbi:MAG: type II toxin-antitoxin system RelE/ParE family toxin [Alphaproteobacteria bacterium]|nr:type II toxin-antitoxin system RelE/ParE family toxin [Alphaproteobacteria bacterium]